MEEDIFKAFPSREAFEQFWNEKYKPLAYEDVKTAFEEFVESASGHIFISDYEEGGCISREDFKDNLSEEARFTFQDSLTEAFYDKNPEIYETAFAIFEASEMGDGKGSDIAAIFHETYQSLYEAFLNKLFDEKLAAMPR